MMMELSQDRREAFPKQKWFFPKREGGCFHFHKKKWKQRRFDNEDVLHVQLSGMRAGVLSMFIE